MAKEDKKICSKDDLELMKGLAEKIDSLENIMLVVANRLRFYQRQKVELWKEWIKKHNLPDSEKFILSVDLKTREFEVKEDC